MVTKVLFSLVSLPIAAQKADLVLILVVMEYGLGPGKRLAISAFISVLILVVMEYGLGRGMGTIERISTTVS